MSSENLAVHLKLVPRAISFYYFSFGNVWEKASVFPQAHPSGRGRACAVLQCLAGDTECVHVLYLASSSVGLSTLGLPIRSGVHLPRASCVLEHRGWVTKALGSSLQQLYLWGGLSGC